MTKTIWLATAAISVLAAPGSEISALDPRCSYPEGLVYNSVYTDVPELFD